MSVEVTRHDDVAVVRMADPERMNSFDAAALERLQAAFDDVLGDDDVRGVVLTGTGKVFCAGADIQAFQAAIDAGDASGFVLDATERLHPLLEAIHLSDKIVVAAVNGVAAGGGLGLALAADARIGSAQARFAAAYFRIGVTPDGGSTWLMPRLIGAQRTRRFFFDNEVMAADEAVRTGMMDALVDADALLEEAIALARTWGRWAAHSRGSTKRLLAATHEMDMRGQLELERGLIAAAAGTADFREGIASFVQKREPTFS